MKSTRTKNIVFSGMFLLSIVIPSILFFTQSEGFDRNEIKMSSSEVSVFKAIDQDFKSKYGLRAIYLQAHNDFKYSFLKESAIPKKVLVGKDGWFFLGNSSSNVVFESLNSSTFSEEEKHLIRDKLKANKSWCDSLGVPYFTCVAPNKLSIYPEFLSDKIMEGDSKFEDLQNFLEQEGVHLIDLSEKIVQQKSHKRLYHKTDTHWNDDGAYLGYLKLMEELQKTFPQVTPVLLDSYSKLIVDSIHMDLTFMLGLNNIEERIVYKSKKTNLIELPRRLEVPEGFSHEAWEYEIRYKNENGIPLKVMLIRDSFSRAMLKYLRDTFQEVVLIWDWKIRKEMVLKEKPDVLIQEIVERDIESFLE